MRIVFIYPPACSSATPYPSLGYLKGCAVAGGYREVELKDANLEFYNYLLRTDNVVRAYENVERTFHELDAKPELPAQDQPAYHRLVKVMLGSRYALENLERARVLIKTGVRADRKSKEWAERVLDLCLAMIAAEQNQSEIAIKSFQPRNHGRSTRQILSAFNDTEYEFFGGYYRQQLIPFLRRYDPDFIGVSIPFDSQVVASFILARMIRAAGLRAHVCFGGTYISALRHKIAASPAFREHLFPLVDSFALYEAEPMLCQLLERLARGASWETVPNLIYREKEEVRVTRTELVKNLNAVPTPDFSGLPLDDYHDYGQGKGLNLILTRGCYWGTCTFCDAEDYFKSARFPSVDKIVYDLEQIVSAQGVTKFQFTDEAFPPKLLRGVAQKLIDKGLRIRWSVNVRFEKSLDEELCRLLARSGCERLQFGLESANPRIIELMDKGTNLHTTTQILKRLKAAGIRCHMYFIVGFPTEIEAEARETLEFLIAHRDYWDSVSVNTFTLEEGTPAFAQYKKYGLTLCEEDLDLGIYHAFIPSSGMTTEQAIRLSREFKKRVTEVKREKSNGTAQAFPSAELLDSVPKLDDGAALLPFNYNIYEVYDQFGGFVNPDGRSLRPRPTILLFTPAAGSEALKLNEHSRYVAGLFDSKTRMRDIISKVTEKYDLPWAVAGTQVFALAKTLRNYGAIQI